MLIAESKIFNRETKINSFGYYNLNTIVYGNPTLEQSIIIEAENEFDYLLKKTQKIVPFTNNSKETAKELDYMMGKIVAIDNEVIKEYKNIEDDLHEYFKQQFESIEVKCTEKDWKMLKALECLALKLKFTHCRPRPNQLAYYYNLRLYPLFPSTTPSFPSSHTIQTRIITTLLKVRHPEKADKIEEIFHKIKNSRVFSGMHYPSDNTEAYKICNIILSDVTFAKKYM